jgi:ribosomal protein S18 acetylase RimI-like enzyme
MGNSTGTNLHVSKLAVRDDCRRQGLGRMLMQVWLLARGAPATTAIACLACSL